MKSENNELISKHYDYAVSVTRRLMSRYKRIDEDILVDTVHDGLLTACRTYDPNSAYKFRYWLAVKLRWGLLDRIRQIRRKQADANFMPLDDSLLPSPGRSTVSRMILTENFAKAAQLSLLTDCRGPLILYSFLAGKQQKEIAKSLGISMSLVSTLYKRIREDLSKNRPNLLVA